MTFENHTRHDFFVANGVGDGNDGDLRDCRMTGERSLDFERGDVLACAADDVLQPVDEVQAAVGPAPHGVAGMEPPVAPRLFSAFLIFQITRKEAAARIIARVTNEELASLLDTHFRFFTRKTNATRAHMPGLAARGDDRAATGLGHR